MTAPGWRLEQYTLRYPQEVLIVDAEVAGEPDQIVIYKGFSSSLMRSTAFDLDVPVLPEDAVILGISRLAGPYNPQQPRYLEQDLTWEAFQSRLSVAGI